jgi:hypothetical protein
MYRQEFTSIQNRKANRVHRCDLCGGIIDIGEVYTYITKFRFGPGYINKRQCLFHPANFKKERDTR